MDFTITAESAIKEVSFKKKKEPKQYYELGVYKATMNLLRLLNASTQKSPNYVKFGIIQTMLQLLITIACDISFAALKKDKTKDILLAYRKAKRMQVSIRVLLDIGAITRNGFSALSSISEDVVRLLNGWYKSETKKMYRDLPESCG